MRLRRPVAIIFGASFAIAGCGGESNRSEFNLCGFTAGAVAVSTSMDSRCVGCSVSRADAAADSNFDTTATIVVSTSAANNGLAIRATNIDGSIFPEGQAVGYWVIEPSGSWCTRIRTYLNGDLQEDGNGISFCTSGGSDAGAESRSTAKPFDAVEIVFTGNATLRIPEICSDL